MPEDNDPAEFWNIVAKPANIDELQIGDVAMVEETHEGKPWAHRHIYVSGRGISKDGSRTIEFETYMPGSQRHTDARMTDVVIVMKNRLQDAKYQ